MEGRNWYSPPAPLAGVHRARVAAGLTGDDAGLERRQAGGADVTGRAGRGRPGVPARGPVSGAGTGRVVSSGSSLGGGGRVAGEPDGLPGIDHVRVGYPGGGGEGQVVGRRAAEPGTDARARTASPV